MPAQMTGHIHHFADEIEVGVVVGGHRLGRKLAGVDAAESDFGGIPNPFQKVVKNAVFWS